MKGAILEKGEEYYTYLGKIFSTIKNVQQGYNWLITDCDCCSQTISFQKQIFQYNNYGWLSGEELTAMIRTEDFQWIWAVLSGFDKNITLEEVLKYDLPYADGYKGFWENPISIQHPLASIEIVAWDSSCTLFISKEDKITEDFRKGFPLSRDLSIYNKNKGIFDETEELNNWLLKNK